MESGLRGVTSGRIDFASASEGCVTRLNGALQGGIRARGRAPTGSRSCCHRLLWFLWEAAPAVEDPFFHSRVTPVRPVTMKALMPATGKRHRNQTWDNAIATAPTDQCSQLTIQGTPNLSTSMPKPLAQKVGPNGMLT